MYIIRGDMSIGVLWEEGFDERDRWRYPKACEREEREEEVSRDSLFWRWEEKCGACWGWYVSSLICCTLPVDIYPIEQDWMNRVPPSLPGVWFGQWWVCWAAVSHSWTGKKSMCSIYSSQAWKAALDALETQVEINVMGDYLTSLPNQQLDESRIEVRSVTSLSISGDVQRIFPLSASLHFGSAFAGLTVRILYNHLYSY